MKLSYWVMIVTLLFLTTGCGGGGLSGINPGSTSGGSDTGDNLTGNTTTIVSTTHNPEPATMMLWGLGLAGAAVLARRKKK